MMRVASQLTFCSPQKILRRTVVEQNEQQIITRLFSLDENMVESAHTLFFDGIISTEIISVKETIAKSDELVSEYLYVDLSVELPANIIATKKPLLLDFGTDSLEEISRKLQCLAPLLETFTAFEIIAACTYFPALVLGKTASLSVSLKTRLILWEGLDLINKRITERTRIREIS